MFEPSRACDPNVAQRHLRERLYQAVTDLGQDPSSIPHTFEPEPLSAFAERFVSRSDVRRDPILYLDLLERAGVAEALCGQANGTRLLERGLEEATEPADRARFLYLMAEYAFFARGRYPNARRYLAAALPLAERFRGLKSHILLLRGRVERLLNHFEEAEETYRYILDSGVIETQPHALSYLSVLRMKQERHEEAIQLNREAHALFVASDDGFGARNTDMDLGLVYLAQGDAEAARRLFETVAARNLDVLDIRSAGRVYNNLAVACERLGDLDGAIRAANDAIHFHAASGRSALRVGSTINLAAYLSARGDAGASLAALEDAIRTAKTLENVELELRGITGAIQVIHDHRTRLEGLAPLVDRCTFLLDENGATLSKEALAEFSVAVSRAFGLSDARRSGTRADDAIRLADPPDREALRRVSPEPSEDMFESMLDRSLDGGLAGRFAPPPAHLRSFLLLYAGDTFRFRHYATEFHLTTTRAKPHLREMCDRSVIRIEGTRKAARYSLAFHRARLARSPEPSLAAPSLIDHSSLG